LKTLKFVFPGVALADPDGDGNPIWSLGETYPVRSMGKRAGASFQKSGLPSKGLSMVHSITLADVDHDGFLEIIALSVGSDGSITIWKGR
jgi:hypothetical protein